jgi:hypothetical protein
MTGRAGVGRPVLLLRCQLTRLLGLASKRWSPRKMRQVVGVGADGLWRVVAIIEVAEEVIVRLYGCVLADKRVAVNAARHTRSSAVPPGIDSNRSRGPDDPGHRVTWPGQQPGRHCRTSRSLVRFQVGLCGGMCGSRPPAWSMTEPTGLLGTPGATRPPPTDRSPSSRNLYGHGAFLHVALTRSS